MSMASQIVIAKNSIIVEYKRRRNQDGDFAVVSEAEVDSKWSEFLDMDGIDSSYFSSQARDEIREMLTEQLEIQQDKDAKAKNKEINKLLRLPMEAAEIFGGALSAVADNGPSDMSAKLWKGKTFQNFSGFSIKEFLKKDLLQFVKSELISGGLSTALIIWQRHKNELLPSLTILNSIPDDIPSHRLILFLEDDFLPPSVI